MSAPAPPFAAALLAAAALLPAAAALALALGGRRGRDALPDVIPWTALPALGAATLLPDGAQGLFPWALFGARLGLDPIGRAFLGFTAPLWLLAGVFGRGYLAGDGRRGRFFFFYGLSMSGNLGLILAQELVGFYVFFALMSFAAYGLVVHAGDAAAWRAGRVYIMLVVIGEVLLFAAFALAAAANGGIRLAGPAAGPWRGAAALLLFLGFGIKAGALPLHVWLPLAHPAAPTPASAVLSGAMIKAGLIGWLRFLPRETGGLPPEWGAAVALLGFAAAFYGVVCGLAQSNPKTILAYSSISQMGLMTAGVGAALLGPQAAAAALEAVQLFALHHGLAKGALFLGVGVLANAGDRRSFDAARAGAIFAALALAGAPLTSGAAAKGALKAAAAFLPGGWAEAFALLLPLSTFGTTLLMGRFVLVAAGGGPAGGRPDPRRWGPYLLLLAGLAAAGAGWFPPTGVALRAAFDPVAAATDLAPIAAGAAVVVGLQRTLRRGARRGTPTIPEGDLVAAYAAALAALGRLAQAAGGRFGSRGAGRRRPAPPSPRRDGVWRRSLEKGLESASAGGLFFLILAVAFFMAALLSPGFRP